MAVPQGQFRIFLAYIAFILIATGRSMEQRIAFRDQLMRGTVADAMRPAAARRARRPLAR